MGTLCIDSDKWRISNLWMTGNLPYDEMDTGYLQHMPATAMDGGMFSSRESLPYNPSSEAIGLCRPRVKVGGTLIERFLYHAGLVLSPRTPICFPNFFMRNLAFERTHYPDVTIVEAIRLGEMIGGSASWHKKYRDMLSF